jgi:hypothetical protein
MNHLKEYNIIIDRAKKTDRRKLNREHKDYVYYEMHHIIPKSCKGKNNKENLVLLTAIEHFDCHFHLCYIYENIKKNFYGMLCAFTMLSKKTKLDKEHLYEVWKNNREEISYIREKYSDFCSERMLENRDEIIKRTINNKYRYIPITKEQEDFIVDLYINKQLGCKEIGTIFKEKWGYGSSIFIGKKLKKLNIKLRNASESRESVEYVKLNRITNNQKENIIDLYINKGKSLDETVNIIHKKYNITYKTCRTFLVKNNILRSPKEVKKFQKEKPRYIKNILPEHIQFIIDWCYNNRTTNLYKLSVLTKEKFDFGTSVIKKILIDLSYSSLYK